MRSESINAILARALAWQGAERVKVKPVLDSLPETLVIDGREITLAMEGFVTVGDTYTVSAAE